jgi:phosphoribosyl 1,2-cyclic phosphodiesterase
VQFPLGGIAVSSFKTPHDAIESVGYRLEAGNKRLAYITDLGSVTDGVLDASLGADIAVIEANHDEAMLKSGPYPYHLKRRILSARGHLSNPDSAGFAARLIASGARYILLAHLSRENNTPRTARETVERVLREEGITVGKDAELDVAPPYELSRKYVL